MKLQPGMQAPDFSAKDQNGKTVSLSSLKGKKIALYFYPEDDTPTCTNQACNLRDNISKLTRKKIKVIGVSPDDVKKHKKFKEKYDLPFTLLADPELSIIKAYDVWGEKQMFGHHYMGVHRTTFLINEEGVIDHVIERVLSKTHTDQILKLWEGK